MKILVTGNLGYVGSHLTKLLIGSGHEVIGCDLSLFPKAVCDELTPPTIQWIRDFRDIREQDLRTVDAVAHLAAISNDPMCELDPSLTLKVNGEGSILLGKLARSAGVKIFAFASTCSVYGIGGNLKKNENDKTNPLSEYSASKILAENKLSNLADTNFKVYILRNATAYGTSSVFRTDLVVNDLSTSIHATGIAEIRSDGTPWRPFIHCRDMARAFQLFIESNPKPLSGKPINIGFNIQNFQVKDIGSLVLKSWQDGSVVYSPNVISDPKNYKVDFSLFESYFPTFKPEQLLSSGLEEMKDFLSKIGYSKIDRDSKRFIRISELQNRISELN